MKPKSIPLRMSGVTPQAAETQVDCGDHPQCNPKCHRQVHFSFLPERYEPLMDDETQEEKKKRKKAQYKKVKKNVSRAIRSTWKCLKLGLYSFALGYSTPISVAAAFGPDFHRGTNNPWAEPR